MSKKVKLTVTESSCRCGYMKKGDIFIVEDLCPAVCHELWNTIYPMVYTLLNGGDLDHGNTRAKCFDAKCQDEGRVVIHGVLIDLPERDTALIDAFSQIAKSLNHSFSVRPLLYGSLGLEVRLSQSLNPDDIDILIPSEYVNGEKWGKLIELMESEGYTLADLHEHTFQKSDIKIAFAPIEELSTFAGIDINSIPSVHADNVRYYLLTSQDYLKVYTESSKDGYRMDHKHKQDNEKIDMIRKASEADE